MKPVTTNPFHFGKAVGGNDFCPRPELEEALRAKLVSGQNVLIQGDRRMGKTSLIRRTAQSVPGYTELYVDLFNVRTMDAVVKRLASAVAEVEPTSKWGMLLAKAFSFLSVSFSKAGFTINFNPGQKVTLESVDEVFAFLHKNRGGKWILIFDEFQGVLQVGEEEREALIARFRSKIQFLTNTPVIFAGSTRNQMHGIFNHPKSAFFKAAVTIDVGPLERDAFSEWLCSRFTLGVRRVNRDVLERVFDLASDVPGDVQQFCSAIWDVTASGSTFLEADIPRALDRVWEQEQRSNEQIVNSATPFQLQCLLALASSPELTPSSAAFLRLLDSQAHGPSVLKAFRRMETDGVLAKHGARFTFVNPYFREWLKARFPKQA